MVDKGASLQIARLSPNVVTILGLCAGLFSVRASLNGQWEHAVMFILAAALIDAVDGRLARMLNSTSKFGAQLDSLADFVNFGVAPALTLYLWNMHEIKGLGWGVTLFFVICCAIRLARFNTDIEPEMERPKWQELFFVGIPAPSGALLTLAPLVTYIAFVEDFPHLLDYAHFFHTPLGVCVYAAVIAMLMASRLPTFSPKNLKIRREYASVFLMLTGMLAIVAFTKLWLTLSIVGAIYVMTFPLSVFVFYRRQAKYDKK